ncbi:MAG: PEGA domain-containing protein [Deltaproteobacteria bacterium]|nr:PEGA domain-containing protein [Deltaproteobacteria bacterium]
MIPVEKEVQEVWHSQAIKKEVIEINSTPANATVTFDGVDHACQTPCKLEVLHGSHAIALWKQDYSRVSGTISVDSSHDKFSFELRENISRVSFANCPAGTEFRVDGNRFAVSSSDELKLSPGHYVLELDHPEYYKEIQKISVNLGDRLKITCGFKPKIGAVDISARNSLDEPVKAQVEVDGVSLGKTPSTFEVRAGLRRIRVSTQDEAWEDTITVIKSATLPVMARLKPIESEQEKALRRAYQSFALMLEIGSMNEVKANDRATGTNYNFADCTGSADPDKGDTLRLILSKNLTNKFGVNVGYLSGKFEACHMQFIANQFEPEIKRFSIVFSGPSIGLNYALVNQWQGEQNPGSVSYTRWFDLRFSYIPSLALDIENKQTQSKSSSQLSGITLAECSLVAMTFKSLKFSLINLSYVKGIEKAYDSALKLGDFSTLSIFGFGLAY